MVLRCGRELDELPLGKFKVIIYKAKPLGSHFGPEPTLCSPAQTWEPWDVRSSPPPLISLHPGLLQRSRHRWKSQEVSLGFGMTHHCLESLTFCETPFPVPDSLRWWHTPCQPGTREHGMSTRLGMLHVMLELYCIMSEAKFCFRKQQL